MIAGCIGKGDDFADAIADFAVADTAQNERDHTAPLAAVCAWRVDAEMAED